jgi:cell division transport system permease protein
MIKAWLGHHGHSLGLALRRLVHTPFATAMNVLVIGIALSLPLGLYVVLGNLQRLAHDAPKDPEITVFLKPGVGEAAGRALGERIGKQANVASASFISREQGLKSLEQSGLGELLAGLDNNPLPHAIAILPDSTTPETIEALAETLRKLPEAEHVSLDSDWAKRLSALLRFGTAIVWMLAGILALALAAITGNTIRLQIYALRDEIEVSRLIGATDRFIRRPFLYFGAMQGLLGGIAGWALLSAALLAVSGHVDQLAAAYGTQFPLAGLAPLEILILLGASTVLGLVGAYLAVGYSLSRLD